MGQNRNKMVIIGEKISDYLTKNSTPWWLLLCFACMAIGIEQGKHLDTPNNKYIWVFDYYNEWMDTDLTMTSIDRHWGESESNLYSSFEEAHEDMKRYIDIFVEYPIMCNSLQHEAGCDCIKFAKIYKIE